MVCRAQSKVVQATQQANIKYFALLCAERRAHLCFAIEMAI